MSKKADDEANRKLAKQLGWVHEERVSKHGTILGWWSPEGQSARYPVSHGGVKVSTRKGERQ